MAMRIRKASDRQGTPTLPISTSKPSTAIEMPAAEGGYSRRRFLQGAAVAATLAAMPASARAARMKPRSAGATTPGPDKDAGAAFVYEGPVVGLTSDLVDVRVESTTHRLRIVSGTDLWRGAPVDPAACWWATICWSTQTPPRSSYEAGRT
jgi:hypothetical protein